MNAKGVTLAIFSIVGGTILLFFLSSAPETTESAKIVDTKNEISSHSTNSVDIPISIKSSSSYKALASTQKDGEFLSSSASSIKIQRSKNSSTSNNQNSSNYTSSLKSQKEALSPLPGTTQEYTPTLKDYERFYSKEQVAKVANPKEAFPPPPPPLP